MKGREVEVNLVDETELKQQENHDENRGRPAATDPALLVGGCGQVEAEPGQPCPGYKKKGLFNSKCKHCGKKKNEHTKT